MKDWAYQFIGELWDLLGVRYVLFGEWLYLKHTIIYDRLPNYLMEYDVYDREERRFLSTKRRRERLVNLPLCE